jgi:SagB-type dehydrogenase family enzyme
MTTSPDLKPTAVNDPVDAIMAYHDQTKHRPDRYARGPRGLDWATQPDPFRRFIGSPVLQLPLAQGDDTPPAAIFLAPNKRPPQPFTIDSLGLFFELSLGLSARKEIPGTSWYLRINPSSGNLHPTEAYAILSALDWLPSDGGVGAGIYHYAPREHALEQRSRQSSTVRSHIGGFHVGLTSIVWREAWKYGERAFRYCQHDVGHALAALRYAAAVLGWRAELSLEYDDAQLANMLGLDREQDFEGAERETPELLVKVTVDETAESFSPDTDAKVEWFGRANRLSLSHTAWPAIDEAIEVTERKTTTQCKPTVPVKWPLPLSWTGGLSCAQLIRQRRSAVNFDSVTGLSLEQFLAILDATLPRASVPPFDAWPFAPRLHLVLFVHRVTGLDPGLYLWLRDPAQEDSLRSVFQNVSEWEIPANLSPNLPLRRLKKADLNEFSRTLSCHQNIAADGAFSLGMLARFEPVLREYGASAWRELFWEAGMIGQALYLAAEAAGMRGTGIGCFFDDVVHQALGLIGQDWQSLYHFTIGQPVDDLRLRTAPPYEHLKMQNLKIF